MADENPAPEALKSSPTPEDKKVEALIGLYRQCSDIYIHFTTWRDRLFAGYITLQGAFAIALGWVAERHQLHDWAWTITMANFFMTLVFWMLADRIYPLFRSAQDRAQEIERELCKVTGVAGVFDRFNEDRKKRKPGTHIYPYSHGTMIGLMNSGIAIANLSATAYLFTKFNPEFSFSFSKIASETRAAMLAAVIAAVLVGVLWIVRCYCYEKHESIAEAPKK